MGFPISIRFRAYQKQRVQFAKRRYEAAVVVRKRAGLSRKVTLFVFNRQPSNQFVGVYLYPSLAETHVLCPLPLGPNVPSHQSQANRLRTKNFTVNLADIVPYNAPGSSHSL